tara:strand:+ start:64 stop:2217 length:2154 start_codon:yes stop_codon:yes gene_type:complete
MAGLKFLYNLILKDIVKGSGQASGILSIGKDVRKLADKKFQRYVEAAKKQGVDLNKLSEQEAKYMLEMNKPKPIRAISADSPEGKGITRDLFNMLDRQSGKNVIEAKFGKPFAEEIITNKRVITDIKKLEPIEAMKEANKVLKGEGRYKSLSKADREKIVNDESVTDHIFERNIIDETEDFAYGGVAGMLGERPGYASGLSVLGLTQTMYPEGDFLNIKANAPTQKDYNIQATKDLVENLPGGVVKDVLAPAAAATLSLPYDAIQASQRMEPGSGIAGFVDAFKAENPISSLKERTIGAAGPLADRFNQKEEEDDEYDFSDIEGQTAMLNPLALIGLLKSGTTGKGITKTLLKNKIQKEIGTKFIKPRIIKKLKESAGVEFGGTGKFKNISTSNKDYGPYKKSTPTPTPKKKYTAPSRPHGNGGGGSGSGRPDNPGGFTNPGKGSYGPHMASGGIARQNFAMGRRAFLKILGGAAAGIGALKTGALSMLGKGTTKKVAKEVITTPAATGKPAWFDALVTRVVNEGEDVTKKFATKDREIVHATKIDDDAMLTVYRDLDEGTVRVDIDDATTNVMDEQGNAIVSMQVKEGEFIEPVIEGKYKGTVGSKTQNTFEAVETDYRNYMDGPDDFVTEGTDNTVDNIKNLTADLTKVKMYAKGQKKPTIKEMMIQRDRAKALKQAEENPAEYAADRGPDVDYSDYDPSGDEFASGGIAKMLGE